MRLDSTSLTISGAKVTADLEQVLTGLTLDAGAGSVAQLVITASDVAGTIAKTALMTTGTTVTWQGEPWQVGGRATERGSDNTVIHEFTCRSTLARRLRATYKASAEKKVSPSQWVTRRVAAAGGVAICQPSSKQGTIAQTSGDNRESELDVIANLAGDLDWTWVEWGGRLWFGSRYWAWQGNATGQRTWPITWAADPASDAISSSLAVDDDDVESRASGSITVPYGLGVRMRPWDRISLAGHGRDNGIYLVEKVTFSADTSSPISVDVAVPNQPSKKSGSSS